MRSLLTNVKTHATQGFQRPSFVGPYLKGFNYDVAQETIQDVTILSALDHVQPIVLGRPRNDYITINFWYLRIKIND